jgi:predicted dehydrogenase
VLCYLVGLPERVVAWTRTQLHEIEVEDTVQAMLEWGQGCLGSLHTSTAEAGRKERLEIIGTGGVMRIDQGSLSVNLFEKPLEQFATESKNLWEPPGQQPLEVHLPQAKAGHAEVYQHLHQAILQGTPLLISGHEGRKSLELANAMLYSSHTGQTVTLPLNGNNYHQLLEDLKAGKL